MDALFKRSQAKLPLTMATDIWNTFCQVHLIYESPGATQRQCNPAFEPRVS
jgi:hypothetical protein